MQTFYSILRRNPLRRGPSRILGGVLGGIGALLRIDPFWVRIAFLLFCLLPGPAFVIYALAWVLLPDRSGGLLLEKLVPTRKP
ncbi:PspC domain-containing protein [Psychromicrobium xiongbiense]|uniref:PspC domain-containing protein n=1 Tax=Psychromicrobium xiongbiense TaxID=3051184 RepID=UPI002553BA14|nr:PspC domain-containing protein [Psychromicrobium sp. YIM S02556]